MSAFHAQQQAGYHVDCETLSTAFWMNGRSRTSTPVRHPKWDSSRPQRSITNSTKPIAVMGLNADNAAAAATAIAATANAASNRGWDATPIRTQPFSQAHTGLGSELGAADKHTSHSACASNYATTLRQDEERGRRRRDRGPSHRLAGSHDAADSPAGSPMSASDAASSSAARRRRSPRSPTTPQGHRDRAADAARRRLLQHKWDRSPPPAPCEVRDAAPIRVLGAPVVPPEKHEFRASLSAAAAGNHPWDSTPAPLEHPHPAGTPSPSRVHHEPQRTVEWRSREQQLAQFPQTALR